VNAAFDQLPCTFQIVLFENVRALGPNVHAHLSEFS